MDTSAQRRLDCFFRHFQLPLEMNHLLHQAAANSEVVELNHGEDDPVVVGGMVLDILATPSISAHPRTTTPGEVNYAFGGVARNVAECMLKLGTRPFMISAVGLDVMGNLLLENWKSAGLSTRGILKLKDIQTAIISNFLDTNGELAAAVSSCKAIEKHLTPEWIMQFKHNISSAPLLMVDGNLNPSALEASCRIAAEHNIPVWFEPVSVAKSRRIVWVVKDIFFASPNEDELIAMANALSGGNMFSPVERDVKSNNNSSAESLFHLLKPAIWVLLEKGIKIVVVTLGSDGVFLCSKGGLNIMTMVPQRMKRYGSYEQLYKTISKTCSSNWLSPAPHSDNKSHLFAMHFPAISASVVKLTGAGDCLVGGVLASICAGLDIIQSIAVGIAASKAAVESENNVPNAFDLTRIAGMDKQYIDNDLIVKKFDIWFELQLEYKSIPFGFTPHLELSLLK